MMALVSLSLPNSLCSPLYSLASPSIVLPVLHSLPHQLPPKGVLSPHSLAISMPLSMAELGVIVAHLVIRKVMKVTV
jgi:hypothetical protein